MPKSFFLKKEVNVIKSSVQKSLYNLLEKYGKWDRVTRTISLKRPKAIGREKTSRLANNLRKGGNQFTNKFFENTIVVDLTRKRGKTGGFMTRLPQRYEDLPSSKN